MDTADSTNGSSERDSLLVDRLYVQSCFGVLASSDGFVQRPTGGNLLLHSELSRSDGIGASIVWCFAINAVSYKAIWALVKSAAEQLLRHAHIMYRAMMEIGENIGQATRLIECMTPNMRGGHSGMF